MARAKTIPIRPITGYMDLRSNPEDVPVGGYRYVQNFGVEQKNKLCRIPGWTRFLDREDYNNHDLHDQLQSLTGIPTRRPITFQMQVTAKTKAKMFLAGTDRALYALSLGTGNWRILSDAMGADGVTRWYGTQNEDTVVLTNDYDAPVYWTFDAPPADNGQSVSPITDLVDLGISRVGVVVTWSGCTFYMNVVEKGTARPNKIYWSDFKKPLALLPSDGSVAGSAETESHESILRAIPMGNVLLVYTTHAIWEISVQGAVGATFFLARRYNPEEKEACLAYKNSIVVVGNEHIYMAASGIYSYSLFNAKPTLVEWINRASSVIYDEIDPAKCDWQIGCYNPNRREIWFSWVKRGEQHPLRTLVLNTEFPFSNIVNHGFTSFGFFSPNEPFVSFGQWLLELCVCDSEEYSEVFGELIKEGGFCTEQQAVVCEDQPDALFTTVVKELDDGIEMEDWDQEEPTENSLCSILEGTPASMCIDETKRDECNAGSLFVMASASDFCLKHLSDVYYRDVCTAFTGCGTYATVGYKSILRSGPLNFKDYSNEILASRFVIQAIAAEAAIPGRVKLRIGVSSMALDSNDEVCGIVWYEEDPKTLECVARSSSTHSANATRPDDALDWPTYAIGKYVYFEITIENPDSDPVDVGAAVCLSSYAIDVQPQGADY